MNNPLINILIRHKDNRRDQLKRCIEAIEKQTYKNYRVIVSYDGDDDYWILNYLQVWRICIVDPMHYNQYMNILKSQVTEGWFFANDDDDYLASPTVLEELSKHLFEGALIVQFLRKDNRNIKGHDVIKPTDQMIEKGIIKRGVIGGGCLVLHHSFKDVADWLPQKGGDYDWIKAVTDKVPTKFVKLVLQISEKANLGR